MEVVIFGGTFDPPTLGHEEIMRAALSRSDIEQLWVMPSAKRKDKPCMSDDTTRLEMLGSVLNSSFKNDSRLCISTFEMELPYATETYKTFEALKKSFVGYRFSFIYGADSYFDMTNWQRGDMLRRTMGMLLVARKGYVLPPETDLIKHLEAPLALSIATSSSDVRLAVKNNQPISNLVSLAVEKYIYGRRLYNK